MVSGSDPQPSRRLASDGPALCSGADAPAEAAGSSDAGAGAAGLPQAATPRAAATAIVRSVLRQVCILDPSSGEQVARRLARLLYP